jgi:hypothetical protein
MSHHQSVNFVSAIDELRQGPTTAELDVIGMSTDCEDATRQPGRTDRNAIGPRPNGQADHGGNIESYDGHVSDGLVGATKRDKAEV